MPKLSIKLLGPFQSTLDGQMMSDFRSDKVRALLVYLAVESQRPWTRAYLADLFWPDYPENKAQSNLGNALWNLRSVIGDIHKGTDFILVEKSTLQFNQNSDYGLDVKTFIDLVDKLCPKEVTPATRYDLSALEETLPNYEGDFMEGFTIDSPSFETWMVKTREQIRQKHVQALSCLTLTHVQSDDLPFALTYCQKWIQQAPWDERAYRYGMRILMRLGRRKDALYLYETCQRSLAEDLGIEPQHETRQLYQQIRQDSFSSGYETIPHTKPTLKKNNVDPGSPPASLTKAVLECSESRPFFGRQAELAQLNSWLEEICNKHGKAAFITGEPGSGKTYLLYEFAKEALNRNPDLLLFWGQCNAFTGQGDPYFPFITIFRMLAGNFEPLMPGAVINLEHLERLWTFLPVMLEYLVNFGPDIIKRYFTDTHQLLLAKDHPGLSHTTWDAIESLMKEKAKKQLGGAAVNDQFTQVMSALSKDHPILIVLDDLQWIDEDSLNLLFHLSRQLASHKILLIGAFRSEEVDIYQKGKSHPLIGIIQELTSIYGKNLVDLAQSEGKAFINDLLSSEPNAFTPSFYHLLYQHTSGHPLFAIELLRGMQLRNEIFRNSQGKWVESDHLNWEKLPDRVEAVIARRFGLLPSECQSLMNPACVQGTTFNVDVLAQVLNKPAREVFNLLSEEVCKRHRLITPQGIRQVGEKQVTSFRFRHDLFQIYLYNQLNQVEKVHWHGVVGGELENLYQDDFEQFPEMAHTLACHFELAELPQKAVQYFKLTGENAARLTAHQDALQHFYHALKLLEKLPKSIQRDQLELALQLNLGPSLTALKGWGAPELEIAYDHAGVLCENIENPALLIPALWLLATFRLGRSEHAEVDRLVARLVELSRKVNDPALIAMSYLQASPVYQGRFPEAKRLLERAAALQDVNLQRHLAHRFGMAPAAIALGYLCNCLWMMGYPDQADNVNQQALDLVEKINHPMTTCYILSRSCWLGLMKGDLEHVKTLAEVLYQTAHKYGFKNFEFAALFFKNLVRLNENEDQNNALDSMQKNLEAYYVTKTILNRTAFMLFFAKACLKVGQSLQGLDAIEQCIKLGEKTGELWFQAETWRVKGELLQIVDDDRELGEAENQEAVNCFWNAYKIAQEQNAKMWELRAAISLANWYQEKALKEKGKEILAETYGWFSEGFETKDLQRAKAVLSRLC